MLIAQTNVHYLQCMLRSFILNTAILRTESWLFCRAYLIAWGVEYGSFRCRNITHWKLTVLQSTSDSLGVEYGSFRCRNITHWKLTVLPSTSDSLGVEYGNFRCRNITHWKLTVLPSTSDSLGVEYGNSWFVGFVLIYWLSRGLLKVAFSVEWVVWVKCVRRIFSSVGGNTIMISFRILLSYLLLYQLLWAGSWPCFS